MRTSRLVIRAFTYYWRTNAAVVLGVATAVAVLGGALLVGDSVRGSLRDLVLRRLGRTDQIVAVDRILPRGAGRRSSRRRSVPGSFASIAPMIAVEGVVGDQASGRRVSRVAVYGVDERFWRFHGIAVSDWDSAAERREVLVSTALAETSAPHLAARCWSGSSGRPPCRSSRCRGAKTTGPDAAAVRAGVLGPADLRRVLAAAATGPRARRVRPASAASAGTGARRPREHAARFAAPGSPGPQRARPARDRRARRNSCGGASRSTMSA